MTDISNLTAEERAIIIAKRAYKKEWRAKNKDKVKASNKRFYLKHAQKLAECGEISNTKKPPECCEHPDGEQA